MRISRAPKRTLRHALAISAAVALVLPTAAQLACAVRTCCASAEMMHHRHAPVGDLVTQTVPDDSCMTIGACSVSIPGLTLGMGEAVPSIPTAELAPAPAPGAMSSQPRLLPTPPPRA